MRFPPYALEPIPNRGIRFQHVLLLIEGFIRLKLAQTVSHRHKRAFLRGESRFRGALSLPPLLRLPSRKGQGLFAAPFARGLFVEVQAEEAKPAYPVTPGI